MKVLDNTQCNIWYQALLDRASEYTGVFFVGVKTTGVFCISVCRARKPKRENVEFYKDLKSALDAGFRPCKVCRPTENAHTAPFFIEQALELVRANPKTRISDTELRKHDISPERIRRWFLQNHGITFQAFQRMQRVNIALQEHTARIHALRAGCLPTQRCSMIHVANQAACVMRQSCSAFPYSHIWPITHF